MMQNHFLSQAVAVDESPSVAYWTPKVGSRVRLFCFPYAGGAASLYRTWNRLLPRDIDVCPVQLPGREGRLSDAPIMAMDALVATLTRDLLPLLDRPYALFGHSLGGLVAFELALALKRAGASSPLVLFASACRAPTFREREPIYRLPDPDFLSAIREMDGTADEVFKHTDLVKLLLPMLRADFCLNDTYLHEEECQLTCPIHVLAGTRDVETTAEELAGWKDQTTGSTKITQFDGGHFFLTSCTKRVLGVLETTLHEQLLVGSAVARDGVAPATPKMNTMEANILKPILLKPSTRNPDTKASSIVSSDNKRYFWAPSVRWIRTAKEVQIEVYSYSGIALEVFPEFYFAAQKGKTIQELLADFPKANPDKLRAMILDLIRNRVLVHTLQSPHEIFHSQMHLFRNPYTEDILVDPTAYARFKSDQMKRCFRGAAGSKLPLATPTDYPAWLTERRSARQFDEETMSLEEFSRLLSVFKQSRDNQGKPTYYYASAGGLYPIDVFVHVKEGRVTGVGGGLHYYNPLENTLELVGKGGDFSEAAYQPNKVLSKSSAFSLFFFYSASATMPKYGGSGFYYACMEVGIMVATLTAIAESIGVAVCSIGDLNFGRIERHFALEEGQVYLHLLELGHKRPH